MWVILQIDDPFMVRETQMRLAEKTKYDSNRSSDFSVSHRMNFFFSCTLLITLSKSLNGIYEPETDVLLPTSQNVIKMETSDQLRMIRAT